MKRAGTKSGSLKQTFRPFPPGTVQAGGEIRRRMELTAGKMLHHIDVEQVFVRHFRRRCAVPDLPGGFSGYGMFLDAVVKAAVHGIGGREMLRFKTERLAELAATQTPDGAITAFSGTPGFWDNHDQAYMIQAYVLDHRYFHCEDSLKTALRLGRFLVGRKTPPNLGLETAFLMLSQESGDPRFSEYCREIFRIEESIDRYDRMLPVNGTAHVYTWIARVLAQLQYAQMSGSSAPILFAGAKELYRRVFGGFSSISGSCSGGINWGELWDATQTGLGRWGETCVSAYLLRCTAKMFEFDPASRYGDLYERILYNAFFGAQSEDGMRQRYFIPFNEPGEWYAHETYCCPNNLRRMMFELPDVICFQTQDGVAVNLYTDSELRMPGAVIRQNTCYPEAEEVELLIDAELPFSLTLRIPNWCTGATVQGKPASAGWYRIPVAAGKTTLHLHFPMQIRRIRGTMAQSGRIALMRGPLIYGVESERNGLSRHDMDLLEINDTRPFHRVPEGIEVFCTIPNQSHPEKTVLFTRFSSEKRNRTFFPAIRTETWADDPLYHPNKKGTKR